MINTDHIDTSERGTQMATKPATPEVTMTAKELAAELNTDPKSFRRFLRSRTDDRAGKGGRWVFDAKAADDIRQAWATRTTKGTTPELKED